MKWHGIKPMRWNCPFDIFQPNFNWQSLYELSPFCCVDWTQSCPFLSWGSSSHRARAWVCRGGNYKKKSSQVSAHRTNTLGTEASGRYRVFLHRKTAFLKASLSNIIIFWKLFTLKGLVASIPGTKRRLIPSVFHSFCGSHREKRITPNYPITVAVTHLFYSQDLPDSYYVLGTIPLFQIVTWSWWPGGSSKIIAGKLVCVFLLPRYRRIVSRNTQC